MLFLLTAVYGSRDRGGSKSTPLQSCLSLSKSCDKGVGESRNVFIIKLTGCRIKHQNRQRLSAINISQDSNFTLGSKENCNLLPSTTPKFNTFKGAPRENFWADTDG